MLEKKSLSDRPLISVMLAENGFNIGSNTLPSEAPEAKPRSICWSFLKATPKEKGAVIKVKSQQVNVHLLIFCKIVGIG
jgi:hypothetical protein